MDKPTCSTCIYSDIAIIEFENSDEETPHSICRRFPPQTSNLWPLIHDEDWCGEHEESVPITFTVQRRPRPEPSPNRPNPGIVGE